MIDALCFIPFCLLILLILRCFVFFVDDTASKMVGIN